MDIAQWTTLMSKQSLPELDAWLAKATTPELYRVNLKSLSSQLNTPMEPLLTVFLHAVQRGAFKLNWEYHCPHCDAIPDFKHNFNELSSEGFCGLCNLAFRNALDSNVQVTFTVQPTLQELSQQFLDEQMQNMMAAVQAGTWSQNLPFLSGLECLNNPLYQSIFGTEVLSAEESLEISKVTLLFTDIKGSTQMYSRLGDAASYRIVRDHFKILFREIEAQGGVVIKTIGDAVMASFIRPEDGVKAALGAYEVFKQREWDSVGKLEIKMGLHTGPVIVVNMNDHLDYFGNTVNKSARIQAVAENHTVCFTQEILDEPKVKQALKNWQSQHAGKVFQHTVRLKGIDGPVDFYRIKN